MAIDFDFHVIRAKRSEYLLSFIFNGQETEHPYKNIKIVVITIRIE